MSFLPGLSSMFSGNGGGFHIDAPANMHNADSVSDYSKTVASNEASQANYAEQLKQWQQSRHGYLDQLYNGMQSAGAGQLADMYRDASQQQQYGMARAGNRGGSADYNQQGQLQQNYANQLGGLESQAFGAQQAQGTADRNTAESWYNTFANNPGEAAGYNAELVASQARAGLAPGAGQASEMATANNANAMGMFSGALGQGLSGIGDAIHTASQLGYFNHQPQAQVGAVPGGWAGGGMEQLSARDYGGAMAA